MTNTERTFTPPLPVVLNYLEDFSHAQVCAPGTQTCTRTGDGPLGVGSIWHNVSKIAGKETELTYPRKTLESDRLTFVGENCSATSTGEISLTIDGDGTQIPYRSHIKFHGAAKLASPRAKPIFEPLANEPQLSDVLNALPH